MKRTIASAAAGALAAVLVAGGVALATVPSPAGVINGCMKDANGQLRVVDAGEHCLPAETAIAWNVRGEQGEKGEKGDKGDRGLAGADGPPGRDGVDGRNGSDGVDGADGADGADGVSVTSAHEPAGTNCTNGGSRFTSVSGTTYACNGSAGSNSQVWTKARNVNGSNVVVGPSLVDPTEIITMAVPTGNYVVHGKAQFVNTAGTTVGLTCRINQGFERAAIEFVPDGTSSTVHVHDVIAMPTAGDIVLSCRKSLGQPTSTLATSNFAVLEATAVGVITPVP
jgi:hypothetical protein